MRENCTYSLSGGRRLARKRASSDPTPQRRSNNLVPTRAESEEGRPRIKENASPINTPPTQCGIRVSQGLAGVRQAALTPHIQDKSRMREIRSYGSVRGALGNQSPYRDWHFVGLFKLRADFIGALRRAQVFDFGNGTVW
jgi:hypothetical protein